MPTEAEWEYACRGPAPSPANPFYFGKSLSSTQANFDGNYPYGGAAKGPYLERTCKVVSYKANGYGLYDMHGNVWEWTDSQDGFHRVIRGGSWINRGSLCRAASRTKFSPTYRSNRLGFRVALVPYRH